MRVLANMLWALWMARAVATRKCKMAITYWRTRATVSNCADGMLDVSFKRLQHLKVLQLQSNNLTALPKGVFDHLPELQFLSLEENRLTWLPEGVFDSLPKLQMLSLGSNNLTWFPEGVFDKLSRLIGLSLANNSVATLPGSIFDNLSKLQVLHLDGNRLSWLPDGVFGNLRELRKLFLHDNNLAWLPDGVFNSLPGLEVLDLGGSSITWLSQGLFDKLSALRKLYLGSNLLNFLQSAIFHPLTSLQVLHLDSNKFEGLPCAVLYLPTSISYLAMAGNPFRTSVALPAHLCNVTDIARSCQGDFSVCNIIGSCLWGDWASPSACSGSCGIGEQVFHRQSRQKGKENESTCVGETTKVQTCKLEPCPVHCVWSSWSKWSDTCEQDCGLPTAAKSRYRDIEQLPVNGGSACNGELTQSINCRFSACNDTMYGGGSSLPNGFTKDILMERRQECHKQCDRKCTKEDLCADAPTMRGDAWTDPKWVQRWFGTNLGKFMAEVALGDSVKYANVSSSAAYYPYKWLQPACANSSECKFNAVHKKETATHTMDNFYRWYFSDGELSARMKPFDERRTFRVGGRAMVLEDLNTRARCVDRCRSWCFESCSCNWGLAFPWSNERDLGWQYKQPMSFKWIYGTQGTPDQGTWKCVSLDGESLRTPWDKPFWSLDIYSDAVKKRANTAPLQFRLECEHVKLYYIRRVCGAKKATKCALNCTHAAQPVVEYLYDNDMLQSVYMAKKSGQEHRAALVDRLHMAIHKNCRRTCAEAHSPAFVQMF